MAGAGRAWTTHELERFERRDDRRGRERKRHKLDDGCHEEHDRPKQPRALSRVGGVVAARLQVVANVDGDGADAAERNAEPVEPISYRAGRVVHAHARRRIAAVHVNQSLLHTS